MRLPDGLYLGHAVKQWHLDTCNSCAGHGRVNCTTCYGGTTETCWSCHGRRTVSCDAYGCYGSGKVACSYCSGSGSVTEQVTDYVTVEVPTTVYENGSSRTSYHTETRTQYRNVQRNCHHCSYGKVTLQHLPRQRQRQLRHLPRQRQRHLPHLQRRRATCAATLATVPARSATRPGSTSMWRPPTASACPRRRRTTRAASREKEGVRSLAAIASSLALAKVSIYDQDLPQEVDALYAGKLRIVRLDAACNGEAHHLVAYGSDLRWLTLDDIVEKLLRGDLKALSDALAGSADDGLFSADMQGLLAPLRDVAASELNADVIEAVLSGETNHAHAEVVSADYASNVRTCVLGALRQVYTRLAKQFWWKGALGALAATIGVWFFFGRGMGAAAGLLATGAAWLLFKRQVKAVLAEALGGDKQAERAMLIAGKGGRHQLAYTLVLAPAIAAALGAGYGLPVRQRASTAPVPAIASTPVSPHVASVPQDASAAKALKLYENGEKGQALAMLDVLVKKGNADAYGLYGWMTLMGEGLPKNPGQACSHRAGTPGMARRRQAVDHARAGEKRQLRAGRQGRDAGRRLAGTAQYAARAGAAEAVGAKRQYGSDAPAGPVQHDGQRHASEPQGSAQMVHHGRRQGQRRRHLQPGADGLGRRGLETPRPCQRHAELEDCGHHGRGTRHQSGGAGETLMFIVGG